MSGRLLRIALPLALALAVVIASLPDRADRTWCGDLGAALTEAEATGNLALLHFSPSGRPVAEEMWRSVWADPTVLESLREDFAAVRLDPEQCRELYAETVGGGPGLATCVLDAAGRPLAVHRGYADPTALQEFLERVLQSAPQFAAVLARSRGAPTPEDRLELGRLHAEVGSAELAERELLELVAADREGGADSAVRSGGRPVDPKIQVAAWEQLARVRARRGRSLQAREALAQVRALEADSGTPERPALRLTEALIRIVERRTREALEILEHTPDLRRGPERPEALLALATARHYSDDDGGALQVAEELLGEAPGAPWDRQARELRQHVLHPPPDHVH